MSSAPLPSAALDAVEAALLALGQAPRRDEPLARRGWWRIGGPADLFVELDGEAALAEALRTAHQHSVPVTILGNGSNLLVADAGVRGLVLKLGGGLRGLEIDAASGLATVGAGLPNAVLIKRLHESGHAGLGCLAGVPGTVGGAVRMNAGTVLGELSDVLHEIRVLHPNGQAERLPAAALRMRYRWAELPAGAVVVSATVRVRAEGLEAERAAIAHHLERRAATQPLDLPSCGSVFKNPPGDHAGRLIEACGLKGHRDGGAQISDKHANFIINTGGATAASVLRLIRLAREQVAERFGRTLEPEVHAVGAWPPGTWPLPPIDAPGAPA
jgi:UDP-N-acetylmuramate dehydrogenase